MTTNKLLVLFSLLQVVTTVSAAASRGNQWTEEDMTQLSSMSLRELGPAPADPTNRVADDPRAVEFGRKLFFDTRLSANGHVSCATCHIPEREFQDGIPLAKGVGVTNRRTMPIAGMAHSPFLFWDGRKDSLWAQALGPLESPVEHGGSREQYAQAIAAHYRPDYEVIFGAMPAISTRDEATAVFVNIGKAIAAY
ncbi:MAG: cytochrome-c peroxidase, partial [Vicinamibacterales bacterium]